MERAWTTEACYGENLRLKIVSWEKETVHSAIRFPTGAGELAQGGWDAIELGPMRGDGVRAEMQETTS